MKKYNNKVLIITLAILVIGLILAKFFYTPSLEGNLRKKLVDIDSAKVTKIEIMRPRQEELITLLRQDEHWKVKKENKEADADNQAVSELLKIVSNIEIQNLASRKKEQWKSFEVNDSSAIKVSIYAESKKVADVRIGKLTPHRGKQGDMYTYVRSAHEDEVYSSNGFLGFYFNKKFDSWRSQVVLKLNKGDFQKIIFNYPDSGFTITRKDSLWHLGKEAIDPTTITPYLNKLEQRSMSSFNDTFIPSSTPLTIRVEGKNSTLATLRAWFVNGQWTINSSSQPNTYFIDQQGETVKSLFVGKRAFIQ